MDTGPAAASSFVPEFGSTSERAFLARKSQQVRLRDVRETGPDGLRGSLTSARIPAVKRRVTVQPTRPPLDEKQILAWCVAHRQRKGRWPTWKSGPIAGVRGENWRSVDFALKVGWRGLSGGSSLIKLRVLERRLCPSAHLAPYAVDEILRWADFHHARHGCWPTCRSGLIPEAPGETWRNVHYALIDGRRGLPGRSTLARILANHRGARQQPQVPRFSIDLILEWADAHHARTGQWPTRTSGPIPEAPGENWRKVQNALHRGLRGLAGGSTIVRLLKEKRGVARERKRAPLTILQVRAWGQDFRVRSGRWPTSESGPIAGSAGDRWADVSAALSRGLRGLPRGFTLARLFAEMRAGE